MMEEEWCNIDEFPYYQISSYGRVKKLTEGIVKRLPDRILEPSYIESSDSCMVHLRRPDGRFTSKSVAYLVAQAFLENPNNSKTVGHKDNDGKNNRVENLFWRVPKPREKVNRPYLPRGIKKSTISEILTNTPIVGFSLNGEGYKTFLNKRYERLKKGETDITFTIYLGETELSDFVGWKGVKDISSHFNQVNGIGYEELRCLEFIFREFNHKLKTGGNVVEHTEEKIVIEYKR